ncbi:hypothetical protein CERSUDRAFT_73850 [Gelatoporia subvermispora B]|uniref:Uncharacterized protein n=1 Tax=Ceriporiopsis subvermispora (strain B) TaxID=914234 RepID=M2QIE4_CERS8|nr:hypothetical protein CERSUDRAFT_73850 [Gelatoporia subvermispora B]
MLVSDESVQMASGAAGRLRGREGAESAHRKSLSDNIRHLRRLRSTSCSFLVRMAKSEDVMPSRMVVVAGRRSCLRVLEGLGGFLIWGQCGMFARDSAPPQAYDTLLDFNSPGPTQADSYPTASVTTVDADTPTIGHAIAPQPVHLPVPEPLSLAAVSQMDEKPFGFATQHASAQGLASGHALYGSQRHGPELVLPVPALPDQSKPPPIPYWSHPSTDCTISSYPTPPGILLPSSAPSSLTQSILSSLKCHRQDVAAIGRIVYIPILERPKFMAPAVDAVRTHLISTILHPAIQPTSCPGMTHVGDWNEFRHALNDQHKTVASDTDASTVPNVLDHLNYPNDLLPYTGHNHILFNPTPDNFEQEIGSPTLLHLLK